MTLLLRKGEWNGFNFSLSIEPLYNDLRNNFTFVPKFKTDHSTFLEAKSHRETISLPYPVQRIKLVRFYSNSESSSTFDLFSVEFDPIYLKGWEKIHERKIYFTHESKIDPPMKHNKWYTLNMSF